MIFLDLLLRWIHIFGGTILVGGAIYQCCVARLDEGGPSSGEGEGRSASRSRWAKLVMWASATLLISGLVNFFLIMQRYQILDVNFPGRAGYQMVFGIKFLIAFAVFFFSAVLAGRSSLAIRLRQNEGFWLKMNLALAVVVVLLAGMLKVAAREPKPETAERSVSQNVSNATDVR
jgi:hypothetical protein